MPATVTTWQIRHGDILDIPADALICSANIYLTLSGGVGGAFLLRYGDAMQHALRDFLADRGVRHVSRGEVVSMPPCGSPYRGVLHAVAVDGAYESSPVIIEEIVSKALGLAADMNATTVALPLLATGYGRLPVEGFLEGLRRVIARSFPPVERVILGVRSKFDVEAVLDSLPGISQSQ